MNATIQQSLHDLPLGELRQRADRARATLHDVRTHVGRVGGLHAIDDALDRVEKLLPGLLERPRSLLLRTVRDLAPHERGALRAALGAERDARAKLARILGEVPVAEAEEALARVEAQESVSAEVMALLQLFERAYCAPVLAGA